MSDSIYVAFRFVNRGVDHAARKWLPTAAPRAVLVIVHGWGAHLGRYADVAKRLNQSGYAVYGFEFEGHGESPGIRAQVNNFPHLVDDLEAFLAVVHAEQPGQSVFLCGHSMGGNVAATYLAFRRHTVAGVIFNSSGLVVSRHISKVKKVLARFLGGAIPRLPMLKLTSGRVMSRDPLEIEKFDSDPLVYQGKMTAGTGKQLLLATDNIHTYLDRISVPLLALQGSADQVVAPEGATAVYQAARSVDKSILIYPDALHDLFHEINREDVLRDVLAWLDARAVRRAD